jgi:hypothetical protein
VATPEHDWESFGALVDELMLEHGFEPATSGNRFSAFHGAWRGFYRHLECRCMIHIPAVKAKACTNLEERTALIKGRIAEVIESLKARGFLLEADATRTEHLA